MQLSTAIVLAGALLTNGIAVERATAAECDAVDPQVRILLSNDPLVGEEFCSELLSEDSSSSTEPFESTIFVTTTITSVIATTIVTADAVTTTEIR